MVRASAEAPSPGGKVPRELSTRLSVQEPGMAKMCDICGVRPATVRARVTSSDGQSEVLELCEVDYRRLARQQRSRSPMESLFGGRGSLFDDFLGDEFFNR